MEINQKIKLHNRWDVEVRDAVTGEVKQTAVGYNVITDNFFKLRLGLLLPNVALTQAFSHIEVGKGTGTPAITDTTLFNFLMKRTPSVIEQHYAYPTSYVVYGITLNADEYNGQTITEVGLTYYYTAFNDYLCTHAMLQDSEGNQISIQKTDTDVVYIRATFYCTFTQSGWGNNGVYPAAAQNQLIKWLLLGGNSELLVRTSRFPIVNSSDLNADYQFTKSYQLSNATGTLATMTLNLPEITILDSEFYPHTVKNIGIAGFGAFQFPDASVFSDYSITRLNLGAGDGVTTDFNIGCPLIKSGTVHIYVNDTELTEGTDYTVDYESNCNDVRENYWTAGMNCKMATVHFGNLASLTPSTSSFPYYDPLYWGLFRSTEKIYASSCTITQANPIWIDFGVAKECNALRMDINTNQASVLNNLVIEYSSDNESWTAVTATRETKGTSGNYAYYRWTWTPVSARYWRCYVPNTNWEYYLRYSGDSLGTRNGTTHIKSTFFLGKSVSGLHFTTAPAAGATIEASYKINVPYKTSNNLMRIACSVTLQRG